MRIPILRGGAAVVAFAALVAGGLTACGGGSGGGSSDAITLGLLAPLTGGSAADGDSMQKGAKLAISELNKAGGIDGHPVKLKVVDVQDQKPDAVAGAVQRLIGDSSVKAVLTGYASSNNFEIKTLAQAQMPYLLAGNSQQTRDIVAKKPDDYPTVWSLTPSYDAYGTELPRFLERLAQEGKLELRNRKAFIVTSDNPYSKGISQGLVETLRELHWTVAGQETVPFGAVNDWGAVLSKVRAADPDLVVNTDYQPANDATFMKQFVQSPTKSIVFIQYGPSVPEFLKLTKGSSTGVLYNLLGGAIQSPKWSYGQRIVERYKKAYGEDPGVYGTALYDLVQLYGAAVRKVGSPDDRVAVGRAIGGLRAKTTFGPVQFDPKTHLARQGDDFIPLEFLQIRDGKRYLVSPEKYKTSDFEAPPWMR
jgi:branched-chain amino acid transport system substrate-binding protein